MRRSLFCLFLLGVVDGFTPLIRRHSAFSVKPKTALQLIPPDDQEQRHDNIKNVAKRVWNRFDTLQAAGFKTDTKNAPQYQIGVKNGIILFCLAFGYKWYRARFINKIPVWDRQPQWNTVVTTKEQEAELKAYTCKTCGATIFIARHRRWFFEGDLGLGGLGCYHCGAKGKDNFVMDRERIVEDVGDEDDYFDYERPLDFVSAAERRKLLKEAGGDEDAANKMLVDKSEEAAAKTGGEAAEDLPDFAQAEVGQETVQEDTTEEETETEKQEETVQAEAAQEETAPEEKAEIVAEKKITTEPPIKKESPKPPPSTPVSDDDIFDLLDMD